MWDQPATDAVLRWMVCSQVAVVYKSDDRSEATTFGQTKEIRERNLFHNIRKKTHNDAVYVFDLEQTPLWRFTFWQNKELVHSAFL